MRRIGRYEGRIAGAFVIGGGLLGGLKGWGGLVSGWGIVHGEIG